MAGMTTSNRTIDWPREFSREWLITNGRGGFAAGTPIGVATRRYHGLLVAAAKPPLERWMLLSNLLERVTIGERVEEISNFPFDGAVHPRGYEMLVDFATSNNPREPWTRFVYAIGEARVEKRITFPRGLDEVHVTYRVSGAASGAEILLELAPMTPMRDFHHLTQHFDAGFPIDACTHACIVHAWQGGPRVWLGGRTRDGSAMRFLERPDWWYGFYYQEEAHRGQDCREDLFLPGWFRAVGHGSLECTFIARALFSADATTDKSSQLQAPALPEPADTIAESSAPQTIEERLIEAADAFVVTRIAANGAASKTVIAGYHWFGDWGRDTFIALPGLLFETKRFEEARQILETFAGVVRNGLVPNRFSDYGDGCDYNSVDASMWFLHAATQYYELTQDRSAWDGTLFPACRSIVEHFVKGTEFDIRMDSDGLITAGNPRTQLTWMDAKCGDVVFTSRHGKPVEINALWYHGLRMLEKLCIATSQGEPGYYSRLADRAAAAFVPSFWNEEGYCLYDTVRTDGADAAIRPNQIFAVSLEHSPLSDLQKQQVVSCVREHLLTPYGLRSLSPIHPDYRGRYEGDGFQRDSRYHQGTVWGWLIGPYVEAYLRVHAFSRQAKAEMRSLLEPLGRHLDEACIGSVSEIFDGDPPHTPRGAVAQAWSVSEFLRAWRLGGEGS